MTEQFFYEEIICNDVAIHSFKVQHTPDGKAFGPFHVLLQENYIVTGCLETIEAFLSPPAKENKYSILSGYSSLRILKQCVAFL